MSSAKIQTISRKSRAECVSVAEDCINDIETKGYCIIPQVFESETTKRARELLAFWYGQTSENLARDVPFLNRDQPMVYNLQNKDRFFTRMLFASELIERVLMHFLNDAWYKQIPPGQPNYILRSYLGRSSLGAMPLHIDSFIPYVGDFVYSIQHSIILQDQSRENGCTVVVPGSQKSGAYADQTALKDAVPIESSEGDVVMWDSRLWHGTTANESGRFRWALVATHGRWWLKQSFNITQSLPAEIYMGLSAKEKAVMGFCSIPHNTEFEGIDMKRGYEELPESI